MKPEDVQRAIEKTRAHKRLMDGPNTCGEATAQWNPDWIRCPVCQVDVDREGFIQHRNPDEVLQ